LVGNVGSGEGHEPVLAPQTINQSAFPREQHWLREREKIPERPNQICALQEIRLYVSRPDRRIQFKDAAGEFFNPHDLAHLGKMANFAFALKRALLHLRGDIGKQTFTWEQIIFACLGRHWSSY
jgi:hypothetical protein